MTQPENRIKSNDLFQKGAKAAQHGKKALARVYIRQAIELNPHYEAAWLYLAGIAETPQDAMAALEQAEGLNPHNPLLLKIKQWVKQKWPTYKRERPRDSKGNRPSDALKSVSTDVLATPETAAKKESQAKKFDLETYLQQQTSPHKKVNNLPADDKKTAKSFVNSPVLLKFMPDQMMLTTGVWVCVVLLSLTLCIGLVVLFGGDNLTSMVATIRATPTNTTAQNIVILERDYQIAMADANQPQAIAILEQIYALNPTDVTVAGRLANHYYEQGLIYRSGGIFSQAKTAFERANILSPTFEPAKLEYDLAEHYLRGAAYHQQAQWAEAVTMFNYIYQINPAYPYVNEILYSAYFNLGLVLLNEGALHEAQEAFTQANTILPEAPEALRKLAEVALLLNPPTPTPVPTATIAPIPVPIAQPVAQKQVIVDISEQHAYAYEGSNIVHDFIISTGEPGRDTAIGQFEILNKIPMAYASTWNLDMPYWLGIYWSGPLQNGFHAVPTVRSTGITMWEGYLGQRVSYGCVILSVADAETLYNWVDIGTPVTIQW